MTQFYYGQSEWSPILKRKKGRSTEKKIRIQDQIDTMKFSLMEIMMAYIGKAHLEEFSDEKKWTILGLINKPGSHLETNIGVEFKMYSNEDLEAILLEKIINLQKQLSEIYPNEKVVQTEIQKQGPDSKTVSIRLK